MKVLVTGGAGYIGSHVCKALARAGHQPIAYDNLSTGHRQSVRWGELVEADLADAGALADVFARHEVGAVMHFAASAYVGPSVTDPRGYYANNLTNGLGLLNAMLDAGVKRLVFSSSCAIFGVQQGDLLAEDHPQAPMNPYGETKLALERALRWYDGAYGLRAVALRYFNAAGADLDGDIGELHDPETHLVPNVLRAASGELAELEIFGDDHPTSDGSAVRDYVHVADLADAHGKALDHLVAGGASLQLNLGTGQGHSVREVVRAAEAVVGAPIPARACPRRPGDPPRLVADGRAARRVLGWTPRHSDLQTILRTAWDWARRATVTPPRGPAAAR